MNNSRAGRIAALCALSFGLLVGMEALQRRLVGADPKFAAPLQRVAPAPPQDKTSKLEASLLPPDLRPRADTEELFRNLDEQKEQHRALSAEARRFAKVTAGFAEPEQQNQVLVRSYLSALRTSARELSRATDLITEFRGLDGGFGSTSPTLASFPGSIYDDPTYIENAARLIDALDDSALFRIIGGEPVEEGDFEAVVATGYAFEGVTRYTGTGTLIRKNAVLTAAHLFGTTHEGIGGRVEFGQFAPGRGRVVSVKKAIRHPGFRRNPGAGERHNDVMVLILAEDVNDVTPIDLAPPGLFAGRPPFIRAVGYGRFDTQGLTDYGLKRMVSIPIAAYGLPGEPNTPDYGYDRGFEFVAGRIDPEGPDVDTCKGDSGGGNFARLELDGPWFLVGITSRGTKIPTFPTATPPRRICGNGCIYHRCDADASDNFTWIQQVLADPNNQ